MTKTCDKGAFNLPTFDLPLPHLAHRPIDRRPIAAPLPHLSKNATQPGATFQLPFNCNFSLILEPSTFLHRRPTPNKTGPAQTESHTQQNPPKTPKIGFPPGVGATGTAALLNVPKSLQALLERLKVGRGTPVPHCTRLRMV